MPLLKEKNLEPGQIPPAVMEKLTGLGLNGELDSNQILHIEADLDADGRWGKRHLVATPKRLVVLAQQKDSDSGKKILKLKREGEPELTIELNLPLDQIESAESKIHITAHFEPGK